MHLHTSIHCTYTVATVYIRSLSESSIFKLLIFCPLRVSEAQHENIQEELPDVTPAAQTIVEPVSQQTMTGETLDMVGCLDNY